MELKNIKKMMDQKDFIHLKIQGQMFCIASIPLKGTILFLNLFRSKPLIWELVLGVQVERHQVLSVI